MVVHTGDLPPPIPADVRLVLPFCWICKRLFTDPESINRIPNPVVKHTHHVIPQAAGGEDGPTVTLCTHHHDVLHRIGEAWTSSVQKTVQSGHTLLHALPLQERPRVLYLAQVVASALGAVAKDPNRRFPVGTELTREESQRLNQLKSFYGVSSRSEALRLALRDAYSTRFPLLPTVTRR